MTKTQICPELKNVRQGHALLTGHEEGKERKRGRETLIFYKVSLLKATRVFLFLPMNKMKKKDDRTGHAAYFRAGG